MVSPEDRPEDRPEVRIECVHSISRAVDPYRLLRALVDEGAVRPALFESALPQSRLSRWSFLAVDPFATFLARGSRILETRVGKRRVYRRHPLRAFQETLNRYRALPCLETPAPFQCGAAAALSYDMTRLIDPFSKNLPDESAAPDIDAALYAASAAVDHQRGETHFYRAVGANLPSPAWLERAVRIAEEGCPSVEPYPEPAPRHARSNMTREAYMEAVESAQRRIARGEIYQVNIARMMEAPWTEGALPLYARLRRHNPAPFAAYIEGAEQTLASSSPERFLRFDAQTRRLETRPIKGTRPVGQLQELMESEKEAAELVMIVDMERNDLGRVCEYGSVRAPELRTAEAYASVVHTSALVEGVASAGASAEDMLRAAFPGGSITGAPKSRAVQIIRELEAEPRGFYTGALGWFDFAGSFDLSVAIRILTARGGAARFGVGSGIVADSSPSDEYEETRHKASALLKALNAQEIR